MRATTLTGLAGRGMADCILDQLHQRHLDRRGIAGDHDVTLGKREFQTDTGQFGDRFGCAKEARKDRFQRYPAFVDGDRLRYGRDHIRGRMARCWSVWFPGDTPKTVGHLGGHALRSKAGQRSSRFELGD